MSDNGSFPNTKYEALTLLYLQNQDLSGITPEDLLKKYNEVHSQITKADKTAGAKQRVSY